MNKAISHILVGVVCLVIGLIISSGSEPQVVYQPGPAQTTASQKAEIDQLTTAYGQQLKRLYEADQGVIDVCAQAVGIYQGALDAAADQDAERINQATRELLSLTTRLEQAGSTRTKTITELGLNQNE